ncbi:Bcr/CflA family drug resistance efflux transporter [Rhodoferax koreense]|uniref:Bcr/CflA family efflux transporter n=1 Tax=Rhodoferax koreensis TaxID=1842727 RepID=A0A1P8JUU5_9BURK|nr:Bcr/CflA family efflux MFS transporter [Rhodoferax koreense]APW37546.1 Bcr/CflA family drug resistance efflux transporter [Rhodoferax koreense]
MPASSSPVTAAPPAHAMQPGLVVLILSLLLGIQPVTTDLYLPALPALTDGFKAPMAQAQLTLSALLLAFGVSQLLWGPLSDRFGRRPILLLGLAAYTLAAAGSALAASMELLIAWRTVQGAAMGAAVMGARAVVRDLYAPETGARVMSKGLSGLGLMACISPPLGGLVSDLLGWRAALLLLALFGATALTVVALRFQETVQRRNPDALRPGTLVRTWAGIVRHPTFLAYTLLATASYSVLFTFLAASSFIFIKVLGMGKTAYGFAMFSSAFAYLAGTFLCRRLLPRFGVRRSVAIAGAISLTGGSLIGGFALAGWHSVATILVPFWLVMLAHGVHQPCSQSGAVGPFPQAAGAASALNGFSMMLAAFGVGGWLGTRFDGTVFPLTNGIWFFSVLIAAVAWTLVQKFGEPGHAQR